MVVFPAAVCPLLLDGMSESISTSYRRESCKRIFFSFFSSVPHQHPLQSKIKHELFMLSRSHSVILTLKPLNLVQFIFSLFLFNFYLSFLVAIIKMLKIKDKFANILKLFSSVEKVETPPICMTVYYKIKSIVT